MQNDSWKSKKDYFHGHVLEFINMGEQINHRRRISTPTEFGAYDS